MIKKGTFKIKSGLAQMLKGGVIMDVTNYKQALIAEKAGAVAVMALEKIPADIRTEGGVARMSDPKKIKEIQKAVTIPVMAKCRIGHFVEAQILEALKIDFVDESEVLTPADEEFHIDKNKFIIPFVCGARDLGEALRRINEGAAMIRTKGEAGTGNIVEAIKHIRAIDKGLIEINKLLSLKKNNELKKIAQLYRVPYQLVLLTAKLNHLPVVNFTAGGIATPADAAMCMQLGADGVFVGSGIFKSSNPEKIARAIVQAVAHFNEPEKLAKISENLGAPLKGQEISSLNIKLATRGN